MFEAFALYLVTKYLVAVATSFTVAIVRAEIQSTTSIAVVKLVAMTAATEMPATLMHCVAIIVVLKPLVVATCVQDDDLFGCLGCQNQFQTVIAVAPVHHFSTTVDVYLLDCFDDLLNVVVMLQARFVLDKGIA